MKKDVKKFKIVDVPAFKFFFKVLYEVSSWDTWNSYSFLSKFIAANRKNYKSNHVMWSRKYAYWKLKESIQRDRKHAEGSLNPFWLYSTWPVDSITSYLWL